MNINNIKKSQKRVYVGYSSSLNIQLYGKDNLYPQRMRNLIQSSHTGGACCERYQTFIEGNGLNNTEFSEYVCNRAGETVDDIFRLIAHDMAMHHGFALHVNYNILGEIVELSHIPFEACRLEEETDDGSVVFINYHPDWTGHKSRKGKYIQVTRENTKKIYTFNPRREVVQAQIIKSGGIESYRGQILWFSMDGKWEYPRPIYDKVVTNLSTDEGLDNVKYRNVRNNFLVAGMLVHKKGTSLGIDENGNALDEKSNASSISESLDIFQGDENACAIMDVTVEQDEDKPEFTRFEAQNFDKKFSMTEESVTKSIYIAFGQEVFYRIIEGSLGFSTEIMSEAFKFYSSYTSSPRRAISRALKRIFEHWKEKANPSDDYEIQPLVYQSNEK
ncbi:hypothetical protein [Prevotella lacticifex]|uniref:Uncharacterized protein n=1 Tax=Prevotella lacticifex TaxID=2854755 RepID=A0A9R1CXS9_9BACT|nr:hypothetical protein [Prevotella lacticifex]GJG35787.1 hypothetical protein PRLR5003_09440 [Prevotella lacticifex]GJG39164.1 hypothetical protein PRLR5019_11350 [Prevotella lacticifex]GJG42156.1 hypothetical protein PRLR5025_09420 [Prevotella lacticifex]GJG45518.1 hypothetical protein PRLR5027_11130 [Prevotella lacticifex]GJG48507.1 hypothetical protein PRLR5052_09200 [Prevotella lacticifex]